MERVILHCDMNNFYASVECLHNPELRGKPVAVCGDSDLRHGIVLAKNYIAKKYGIKTGDVIFEARNKCKDLVVLKANFPLYLRFSKMARRIYERYTNKIESFGIDECWLDVSESIKLFGSGEKIADEIRESVKFELGCTASVGVSWNKIFAKLGSDMKKPDATIVITKENYKQNVWQLPVEDLLYVGRKTAEKLKRLNINTIGEFAQKDVKVLKRYLNKWGEYIWQFANGLDSSPVSITGEEALVKSVGNSTTAIRDLKNYNDVLMIITVLSESIAARLREQWLKGRVVSINLRDKNLMWYEKQMTLEKPTFVSSDIINAAMKLYKENFNHSIPIRSVGVKVSNLTSADAPYQTNLFFSEEQCKKYETLEYTLDYLRQRFGFRSIRRASLYLDTSLTNFNPKQENVIYPYSFFKGGV